MCVYVSKVVYVYIVFVMYSICVVYVSKLVCEYRVETYFFFIGRQVQDRHTGHEVIVVPRSVPEV